MNIAILSVEAMPLNYSSTRSTLLAFFEVVFRRRRGARVLFCVLRLPLSPREYKYLYGVEAMESEGSTISCSQSTVPVREVYSRVASTPYIQGTPEYCVL